MRMWQGVSARSSLEGIVSPAYTVCIPNARIDSGFAAVLFKSTPLIHAFQRYSQGLVDDTLSLKFNHFAEIRVRIPGIDEQRRIAAVFRAIDAELRVINNLIDARNRRKQALLDNLLSGVLRFSAT